MSCCPTCTSPAPELHPATKNDAQLCRDEFHLTVTSMNTPEMIAEAVALMEQLRLLGEGEMET